MTIIKTKDFILRPARLSDAKDIYRYQQESEAKKNFISVPQSISEARKDILKRSKNQECFVIDIGGEVAGEISFHFWEPPKKFKVILSYWVAKKFRGRNIATNAIKLITKYALNKYPIVRIEANVRTFNKASARALEKAGYKLEGIMRKNKCKNGKYLDDMVWAKVK